jgi:lysozyme family protein
MDQAMSNFDAAFIRIVGIEGGYSDDPKDPGGKTKFGITERVARAHAYQGDMRALPLDVASSIYRAEYWDICRCDSLPWPLALYVFDAAVNQGQETAIKMLQRALDTVQDGHIGQQTLALAAKSTAWHAARFLAFRALQYTATRGFDTYGVGWLTRLFEIGRQP